MDLCDCLWLYHLTCSFTFSLRCKLGLIWQHSQVQGEHSGQVCFIDNDVYKSAFKEFRLQNQLKVDRSGLCRMITNLLEHSAGKMQFQPRKALTRETPSPLQSLRNAVSPPGRGWCSVLHSSSCVACTSLPVCVLQRNLGEVMVPDGGLLGFIWKEDFVPHTGLRGGLSLSLSVSPPPCLSVCLSPSFPPTFSRLSTTEEKSNRWPKLVDMQSWS